MITWGNHSKAQQELEGEILRDISQSYDKFRLWQRQLPGRKTQTGQGYLFYYFILLGLAKKLLKLSLKQFEIYSAVLLYLIQLLNRSEVSLRGNYNYVCVTLPQDA